MSKLQVNIDRKVEPEREFQPILQCSSARPPVRGWPLGWRRRGSPEKNKQTNTHIQIFMSTTANSNDGNGLVCPYIVLY